MDRRRSEDTAVELASQYNAASAEKRVAELGDMARVLDQVNREDLAELCKELGPAISYDDAETRADVSINPRVNKLRVRGGT